MKVTCSSKPYKEEFGNVIKELTMKDLVIIEIAIGERIDSFEYAMVNNINPNIEVCKTSIKQCQNIVGIIQRANDSKR